MMVAEGKIVYICISQTHIYTVSGFIYITNGINYFPIIFPFFENKEHSVGHNMQHTLPVIYHNISQY